MRTKLLATVAFSALVGASSLTYSNPVQYYQNGYYVPPGYVLVPANQVPGGTYYQAPGVPAYPSAPGYPPNGQQVAPPGQAGYAQPVPQYAQPAPPPRPSYTAPGYELPGQPRQQAYAPPSPSPAYQPPVYQPPAPSRSYDNVPGVTIGTVKMQDGSVGTGYIFQSSTGEVLLSTAFHVVGQYFQTGVIFETDGRQIRGQVIGTNKNHDQAIIRLESTQGFTPARIGEARVGEVVSCYGFKDGTQFIAGNFMIDSEGASTAFAPTPHLGPQPTYVESLYEVHSVNGVGYQPGMSGGPCLNRRREVVGFNSATNNRAPGGRNGYMGTPIF